MINIKSILKKDNSILFYPTNEQVSSFINPPSPAYTSNIPSWHKKLSKYMYGDKKFKYRESTNLNAKSCLPLTDAFTSGYVFTLPYDVYTGLNLDGSRYFRWSYSIPGIQDAIVERPKGNEKEITGWNDIYGYEDLQFNWWPYWSIKTPPGYSCIFTHPINRIDLPFYTLGGILDTDGWGEAGNQPFLVKSGWEGVISAGTPIIQVIPFKRDSWKKNINKNLIEQHLISLSKRDTFIHGFYKNNIWSSKSYR
jgi:hypothetical protein